MTQHQTTDAEWYVGKYLSGKLIWAEKNLSSQGFNHYAPRLRHDDGTITGENLFQGYILVECTPSAKSYRAINSTRGMQKLLPLLLENPLPLPTNYVQELQDRIGLMGTIAEVEQISRNYLPDDMVRVLSGPYAGCIGKYDYKTRGIVNLLMSIIGGHNSKVSIPLYQTELASRALAA